MRILVVGYAWHELVQWAKDKLPNGTFRLSSGIVEDGEDIYHLFEARQHDERICGYEFHRAIYLTMLYHDQYARRVRLRS